MEKNKMDELFAYLDKMGATYTVDNNPSPEKIERIRKQIEENERKARMIAYLTLGKTIK